MSAAEAQRAAAEPGLRGATGDDLPAMAEIFVQSWLGAYGGIVPDDVLDALRPASVAADLAVGLDDPRLTTVMALDTAGKPVGFARFGDDPADRGNGADAVGGYLAALYMHPAATGLGVGRRLLRHALDAMPGRPVRLWVFEANSRARALYEKAGFRAEGPRGIDPRWRTPQIRMRRPARNEPRPLPPIPDVVLPSVRAVSTTTIRRPLRRPFRTALRTVRTLSAVEVVLHTADGATATGTTVATPAITGDTADGILDALHGPLTQALRGGPRTLAAALRAVEAAAPGVPSARAAADLALHHLATGPSGARRSELPAFSGLPDLLGKAALPVRSDLTISVDTPAAMAAAAREGVGAGFDTLKLKLADPDLDVRRVTEVHAELGGAERRTVLRVDANQAWTPDEAIRVLDRIAALGIDLELVEQPTPAADIAGLARVRRNSPWPILADESVFTADDVRRVADASAADLVNLKLLKCGGLGPARDVVAACAESGLGLIVGCMLEPAEGVTAARHLAAAAAAGPLAHDLDAGWWTAN
ncbi:GNAT family N-acetyltransferase [Streptomycetaceae bacterium NBC_01309]